MTAQSDALDVADGAELILAARDLAATATSVVIGVVSPDVAMPHMEAHLAILRELVQPDVGAVALARRLHADAQLARHRPDRLGDRLGALAALARVRLDGPSLPNVWERTAIRQRARITQREAAAAVGVSQTTFGRWENGDSTPNADNLTAYLELLDTLEAVAASGSGQ